MNEYSAVGKARLSLFMYCNRNAVSFAISFHSIPFCFHSAVEIYFTSFYFHRRRVKIFALNLNKVYFDAAQLTPLSLPLILCPLSLCLSFNICSAFQIGFYTHIFNIYLFIYFGRIFYGLLASREKYSEILSFWALNCSTQMLQN